MSEDRHSVHLFILGMALGIAGIIFAVMGLFIMTYYSQIAGGLIFVLGALLILLVRAGNQSSTGSTKK